MFKIPYIFTSQERFLERFGLKKIIPHEITRDNFFESYFRTKRPFVVQIGANDGKTHDSLYTYILKYQLPGLLVEPQPDIFNALKENYKGNKNLQFANVAVGEKDGQMPFYRIKPELVMPGKEYKASSGSSFFREQIVGNVMNRLPPKNTGILKHISNNPDDYIQETQVMVKTLPTLLREFKIDHIDFLLTDCQGADYTILTQLDFDRYAPDIINYEHCLLSAEDLSASRELLIAHEYKYFIHGVDTCGYNVAP